MGAGVDAAQRTPRDLPFFYIIIIHDDPHNQPRHIVSPESIPTKLIS